MVLAAKDPHSVDHPRERSSVYLVFPSQPGFCEPPASCPCGWADRLLGLAGVLYPLVSDGKGVDQLHLTCRMEALTVS